MSTGQADLTACHHGSLFCRPVTRSGLSGCSLEGQMRDVVSREASADLSIFPWERYRSVQG